MEKVSKPERGRLIVLSIGGLHTFPNALCHCLDQDVDNCLAMFQEDFPGVR